MHSKPRQYRAWTSPTRRRTFVVLALTCFCTTAARAQGVDATIKPGDDFFAYANGDWLKATTIPAGKERWGARDEINERTRQRIATLLDDAHAAAPGSLARKVADYRAAWLNESAIEARGLGALKPQLDSIDRLNDKTSLTRMLGSGIRADVDPLNWGIYRSAHLLGLSVEEGIHGETTNVAFLVQGGLGLPDRDNYLSSEPRMHALRTKYQEHIARMLALAGFDRASERAESVMSMETAIARTQATREASANDHNADSLWTRAELATQAPGMDWTAFLAAAGLANQHAFVAWQPSAVRGVAALVASQPLEAWKDYLRYHAILDLANVLPRAIANEAETLRTATGDASAPDSRAQRALAATQLAMGEAIGRMYAERYFPAEQKRRVLGVVNNVTRAFIRRVEAATWMSPDTKSRALKKLNTLYVGIGYQEKWQDFSDLVVDPTDAAGNLQRAERRAYRRALARLGKPVDMHEWWIAPQRVGAILVFQQNAYDFSAALLQAPKFDANASEAAAYGAIGAIIGHDVSHFVDILGAEYDVDGSMHRWWTPDDSVRFDALVQPLVNQFSAYEPFPGVHINGKLTATENIADLAGLSAAFDAYRATLGKHLTDTAYVRRHDREFFIAFAQSWRTRISEPALRTQVASNDHSPENFRISTVRNMDAWYDAFDVRPGQRLYLAPVARVRIW